MEDPTLKHIAIIMDGNGRWAKKRSLDRVFGHKKGAETMESIIDEVIKRGVSYLTLFAFSTENWNRPKAEVDALMKLLDEYLDKELARSEDRGVRMVMIGERERLSAALQEKIAQVEEKTRSGVKLTVFVAVSYGGRQDITRAVNLAISEGKSSVTMQDITDRLYTAGVPDPDLLIRTSGEQRLSNFMMWQLSYSELVFIDALWPDFTASHLGQAIEEYNRRVRRFGSV